VLVIVRWSLSDYNLLWLFELLCPYFSFSLSLIILFALNIGPCHPSAHGVFRVLVHLLHELLMWLDICVGLLHRSTEMLTEHRHAGQISGLLSRTDYVAHIQLESLSLYLCVRYGSSDRSSSVILLHLSLLANHLLNVACSIGDLGCVSLILWSFEDRDNIFSLLDGVVGARLHSHLDGPVALARASPPTVDLVTSLASQRSDSLLDVLLLRHNLLRLSGTISIDSSYATGSAWSGPLLYSSGIGLDTRSECSVYSSAMISLLLGAMSSCSYIRVLVRLFAHRALALPGLPARLFQL
jgi:NADH-quinone oxidoreductase subunit D